VLVVAEGDQLVLNGVVVARAWVDRGWHLDLDPCLHEPVQQLVVTGVRNDREAARQMGALDWQKSGRIERLAISNEGLEGEGHLGTFTPIRPSFRCGLW
jgi:hypothetical protein